MSVAAQQIEAPQHGHHGRESRAGFKNTEAGIIPEDWEVRPLLSVVRVANGQVDPREPQFRSMTLVAPDHIESGTGRLLARMTAEEQRAISGKYRFSAGDIVYSKIRPNLRKAIFATFDGLCSADMYPLTPIEGVSVGYIFAVILGEHFSQYAESVSVRSGMPKINREELSAYQVAMPSTLREQQAIAEALLDADALIESLEGLIVKKRAIKQGAMQELLSGRRRLPGFGGESAASFAETEAGMLPGDWRVERLGELLLRPPSYGINAPAIPYDLRFPAYIRITDITEDGRFNPGGRGSVAHPNAGAYRLADGDVVLARTGASTGKSYLYRPEDGALVFAGFLIKVSPDPHKLLPKYLGYQLQTSAYWNWVRTNSMRSGQPGINGQQFASLPVPLPPTLQEQQNIAQVLSEMDDELEALAERLAKARQIKQGMMQELLTGRVRLL